MVQKRDNRRGRRKLENLDSELILLLVKEELHIRAMAKKLGKSHSTILRRLNKLVNEGVLDYRIEGKNKVFFVKRNLRAKSYVFNAERYKQIKLLKKYPELGVIAEDILKSCDKRLIIIFGSYAKFAAKRDSDIDVFVETKDKNTKRQLESIHSKINAKIGVFDSSVPLIKEMIKSHVILRGVEEFYERTNFLNN